MNKWSLDCVKKIEMDVANFIVRRMPTTPIIWTSNLYNAMLTINMEERYQSAADLLAELKALHTRDALASTPTRPKWPWMATAAVVLVLAAYFAVDRLFERGTGSGGGWTSSIAVSRCWLSTTSPRVCTRAWCSDCSSRWSPAVTVFP